MHVVLDAGPLGDASRPSPRPAQGWLRGLILGGHGVVVPEIADYEVRRELIRAGKDASLHALDRFVGVFDYLAIDTATMRLSATLWAEVRRDGRPTAPDHALDGDVILAAQARLLAERTGDEVVIATTNPKRLSRFVDARVWSDL